MLGHPDELRAWAKKVQSVGDTADSVGRAVNAKSDSTDWHGPYATTGRSRIATTSKKLRRKSTHANRAAAAAVAAANQLEHLIEVARNRERALRAEAPSGFVFPSWPSGDSNWLTYSPDFSASTASAGGTSGAGL
ncbi:MAG: hypothetical protein J2O39_03245 [Acidimicrobiales bacterium]|nr:hypothetical protein [Acidimicrobiales bacterium]